MPDYPVPGDSGGRQAVEDRLLSVPWWRTFGFVPGPPGNTPYITVKTRLPPGVPLPDAGAALMPDGGASLMSDGGAPASHAGSR
jgi:hypothetical protein